MKTYTTVDLENRLYDFINTDKEHLSHYSYILTFINYLNENEHEFTE